MARTTKLLLSLLAVVPTVFARDTTSFAPGWNGLARTPPMGWRSWNAFGNRISQDMMMAAANAAVAKNHSVKGWAGKVSLCDLGYCSVGVDEGWEGCGQGVNKTQHDANGIPTIDAAFPDTAAMVKGIHGLGLSAGWYLNGCKCGEHTELTKNYAGDIKSLHEFDFDGVKIDGCGDQKNQTLYAALMRDSGKNYTIENCHWGDCTEGDDSSCPTTDWCPWNWYRTSRDINSGAMSWLDNLQTTTRFQDYETPLSVPGCWAYPDMLEVGRVAAPSADATSEMTWNRAHFGAWCITSAPLILGLDITNSEKLAPILDIIGNKAAIAVNQQWAGHPGMLVQNVVAPPQHALAQGIVVPSSSPGDFGTSEGANIGGGRRPDNETSGASNIRTGGPGGTGVVKIGTGIVGTAALASLDSIEMSFRYTAGYTPAPGQTKKGSVVSVQVLDMATSSVLKTVWTSDPLGKYSWDHGDPNSPPVKVSVKGLGIKLSAEKPVMIALSVANNDRNLQIPIDDKAGGFDVRVGFGSSGGALHNHEASSAPLVGLAPYYGDGVPFGVGQVWAKKQPHGALAVLLINHGGKPIDAFSLRLKETLNLTAAAYTVLDVWAQAPRGHGGPVAGNLTFASVKPYDSDFLVLTPHK